MSEKIHLIGIGGSGMSGLASLLVGQGYSVTGSDLRDVRIPGAKTFAGHNPEWVPPGVKIVVRSPAIPEDNPEMEAARRAQAEVLTYPEMVGRLMNQKRGIAVAGTHGKTTTTAMISFILSRAGLDPSYICGARIPQLEGSAKAGSGRYFVAEACEYYRSFLNMTPRCAVITNIEEDHLDYYKDLEEITGSFHDFASRVGESGVVIGSADSAPAARIVSEFKGRGETFSLTEEADWRARNIEIKDGQWSFDILKYGKPFGSLKLSVAGEHNVSNALAAMAAATWAGVGQEIVLLALQEYQGTDRRLQLIGERNGAIVLDDYAHHPTEIQATLKAVRGRYPDKQLWCVFQPHLYSRTRQFLKDFAGSFADANLVLLTDVFAAREGEAEQGKISSDKLAQLVDESGKAALYLPGLDDVENFLKEKMTSDCVIITMGAGNIGEIAHRLVD